LSVKNLALEYHFEVKNSTTKYW